MDCREIHLAYKEFVQGKLSPDQVEFIKRHVQDCPDCILLDEKERKIYLEEHRNQLKPENLEGWNW